MDWFVAFSSQHVCLADPAATELLYLSYLPLSFWTEIHVPVTPIRPQILEGSQCILFIFVFAARRLCLVPVFQVHDAGRVSLAWLWSRVLFRKYKEEAVVGKEGWGRRIYTTINRGVLTMRIFYDSTWAPAKCIGVLISRQVYCLLSVMLHNCCATS